MVSVVIPVLNEERAIGSVVGFCRGHPQVGEVIVVDDGSTDRSAERALRAGARVIPGERAGKGGCMRAGVREARHEVVLFLDGDIDPYPAGMIDALVEPVLAGRADLVKAAFDRARGRVTERVARPLLRLLAPELARFRQPLGGMVAGRRALFREIGIADGYGADIGILFDARAAGARIAEAEIGWIDNPPGSAEQLRRMAREVAATILERTTRAPQELAR